MGNFNNFFFAAHLLDVAVDFKTLRTILQSITHNGKQLARKQDLLEKRSSSSGDLLLLARASFDSSISWKDG